MRACWLVILTLLSQGAPFPELASTIPPAEGETLHYRIAWASGLDVGTATVQATPAQTNAGAGGAWHAELTYDLGIPGKQFTANYQVTTTGEFCAVAINRRLRSGQLELAEQTSFDYGSGVARQQNLDGSQTTEFPIPSCVRDAVGFFYWVRNSLREGRLPPPQRVHFGTDYVVTTAFVRAEKVQLSGKTLDADVLSFQLSGPDIKAMVQLSVARDAVRTPVHATVSLDWGTFLVTLVE